MRITNTTATTPTTAGPTHRLTTLPTYVFAWLDELKAAARSRGAQLIGLGIDPEHEVVCVSGGKEGIAHLVMAFTDEESIALVPDIHYPVHSRVAGLVGGRVHLLPLRRESGFLPDLEAIPESVARRARL